MHVALMTAVGLVLVGLIYGGFRMLTAAGSSRWVARGAGFFVFVWLVVAAVDFYLGVMAGYSVGTETAAHAVIFGVPALAALYAAIRASRRDPARPA